ncbi:hypothetical protein ICW40_13255 [Actinotalea ferrariae]|uniref:hypothetical protein n=1 Tax=Actinotalea ferrariae TaxID=1386098 RepID=UPI001C8BF2E7|nr:hypothetical protein [Actinotalea ferrariae]MBX9245770.1 hypothetical protein [Actinotalea ferrariae]
MPPRRVQVVGPQAAGKTRFARGLAAELGVPLVEVDVLVRLPDGTMADVGSYRAACVRALGDAADGWVVDGDDVEQVGIAYASADAVVWLDAGLSTTLPRLVRRVVRPRRGWSRAAEARALRWALAHHASDRHRWSALAAQDPARWRRVDARRPTLV